MADGVQEVENETENGGVEETPLGGREFRGAVEHKDPFAPTLTPAPEGVPEQFWDPVEGKMRTDALLKSYSELRKKMDGSKEETEEEAEETAAKETEEAAEEETEEETSEEEKSGEEEATEAALTEAITAAQEAFAKDGELSAEARAPLKAAGITDEQIDFYIAGVKATEAALQSAAEKAAGSAEDLQAAMEWAAKGGLSEKQIIAFNAQTGDVETIGPAVAGLMTAFRAANPGEGKLTRITTGHSRGDVYTHMDEFQQDLAQADKVRDPVARRKAVDKLRRSRQAGSIKG